MKMKQIASALLVLTMLFALFACTPSGPAESGSAGGASSNPSGGGGDGGGNGAADPYRIVDEKITLTYVKPRWIDDTVTISSWNDNKSFQKAEELTNIHIDFLDVVDSSSDAFYSAMWATGLSYDIVNIGVASRHGYPGGFDKAIDDGVIVDLTGFLDGLAPNYKQLLDDNPNIRRIAATDKGRVPGFELVQLNPQRGLNGIVVRQDWLDTLGLDAPTTLGELHDMLSLFRREMKATVPLLINHPYLNGISASYSFTGNQRPQLDPGGSGKVVYGPVTDNAREYLILMNTWYNEGLFGPDNEVLGWNTTGWNYNARPNTGDVGSWTAAWWGFDDYKAMLDPNAIIEAIPYPLTPDGKMVDIQMWWDGDFGVLGNTTVVNAGSKYRDEAIRWLDFWYSEYGTTLANYGVEGISWEYDSNGEKQYIYDVLAPEDTVTFRQKQSLYMQQGGPFNRFESAFRGKAADMFMTANQARAQAMFENTSGMGLNLPPVSLTAEEQTEIDALYLELNPYVESQFKDFIMNVIPIEGGWTTYVAEMRNKGVDRYVEIYQAAYDRFLAR